MISASKIDIWGFEGAIRGMRNPLESHAKSDSFKGEIIGPADLALMRKLFKAGTEHRKFLRQIYVSMDIIAPLYWWKEFDTYKVGTVANSYSTMHCIHKHPFVLGDFAHEHLGDDGEAIMCLEKILETLNFYREIYLDYGDKEDWYKLIQLLPSSYLQKRTVTFNYEVAATIIKQRSHHKLDEWNVFVDILHNELTYLDEIMEDMEEEAK